MGKRRSGVIQVLLACGCALVVGAIVVVAAIAYLVFFRKSAPTGPPAITDSGQVRALAEQILPGNEPPPGHVGFLGQAGGNFLVAFQGPAGLAKDGALQPTQLLLAMASFPAGQATREQAEKSLRDALNGQGYQVWASAHKVLDQSDGVLNPKFGEVHVVRRTLDGSPKLMEYSMLLENSAGRTVVLLADGPLESFNTPALEAYLNRLQARALGSPTRIAPPSTPTPEPAATPDSTPEETPGEIVPEDTPTPVATPKKTSPPPKKKPH